MIDYKKEYFKKTPKILIVDDLDVNIVLLRAHLLEAGYDVIVAKSGKEGLTKAFYHKPDLIILDIMMPIMDGYEVCKILKESDETRNIPVIFLTALQETKDKVKGLEVGGDDFISKPFNDVELLARVRSLLRIKYYNEQIIQQNKNFQKELEMARILQNAVLPQSYPKLNGLEISSKYIPSSYLSGDYFNFIRLSENKIGIFISDVMGHGVQASLVTMLLKSIFENNVYNISSPKELMKIINDDLVKLLGSVMIFATAAYAIIDLDNKLMSYSTAGHPPILQINNEIGELKELRCKSGLLGIYPDFTYQDNHAEIKNGDFIVFYTDGILDVTDTDEVAFGDGRFYEILNQKNYKSPKELIDILGLELFKFSGKKTYEDDINLVGIKIN